MALRRPKPEVSERRMKEARREYLRQRVTTAGGPMEFSRQTGITHPNISRALTGRGCVTDNMLSRIAATVGPNIDAIYQELAAMFSRAAA